MTGLPSGTWQLLLLVHIARWDTCPAGEGEVEGVDCKCPAHFLLSPFKSGGSSHLSPIGAPEEELVSKDGTADSARLFLL